MKMVDRVIGIGMMLAGAALFVFGHMLEPYISTLSGATLYAVAIPTAVGFGASIAALFMYGLAQATGSIPIGITGGK